MDPLRNAKRRASARSPGSRRGLCQTSLSSLRSGGSRSSNDKGFFRFYIATSCGRTLRVGNTASRLETWNSKAHCRELYHVIQLAKSSACNAITEGGEACGAHSLITGLCALNNRMCLRVIRPSSIPAPTFLAPELSWHQKNADTRSFLHQTFSGTRPFLVPAFLWCEHFSGGYHRIPTLLQWILRQSGPY
jgi:hypothetical protein